jgi:hypothetical protein
MLSRYAEKQEDEAERFVKSLLTVRTESFGLLKDLHDLWSMANEVKLGWIILRQCSKALRDEKLQPSCMQFGPETVRQIQWLIMKIKHSAPQILTVPA